MSFSEGDKRNQVRGRTDTGGSRGQGSDARPARPATPQGEAFLSFAATQCAATSYSSQRRRTHQHARGLRTKQPGLKGCRSRGRGLRPAPHTDGRGLYFRSFRCGSGIVNGQRWAPAQTLGAAGTWVAGPASPLGVLQVGGGQRFSARRRSPTGKSTAHVAGLQPHADSARAPRWS